MKANEESVLLGSCLHVAEWQWGSQSNSFSGGFFVAFFFSIFAHDDHFYFGHDVMKFLFCFLMDNLKFVFIYNHTGHSFMSCSF